MAHTSLAGLQGLQLAWPSCPKPEVITEQRLYRAPILFCKHPDHKLKSRDDYTPQPCLLGWPPEVPVARLQARWAGRHAPRLEATAGQKCWASLGTPSSRPKMAIDPSHMLQVHKAGLLRSIANLAPSKLCWPPCLRVQILSSRKGCPEHPL